MPNILTQKELQNVRDLDFCYLCGKSFQESDETNFDHVPPRTIFKVDDRTPPLKLPTHTACNERMSISDELIGQLFTLLHGNIPEPDQLRLPIFKAISEKAELPLGGVVDFPFTGIIFRFVRGFHSALYRTFMEDTKGYIYAPIPVTTLQDGKHVETDIDRLRFEFTRVFKKHIKLDRTDRVLCYNGLCDYRCTWLSYDNDQSFCLFALRLYNWEQLGDPRFGERGCLGWYFAEPPAEATRGTRIEIPFSNWSPLDPFGV